MALYQAKVITVKEYHGMDEFDKAFADNGYTRIGVDDKPTLDEDIAEPLDELEQDLPDDSAA